MIINITKQELKYILESIDTLGEHLTTKATKMHQEESENSRELNHYIQFGNDLFSKLTKEMNFENKLNKNIKRSKSAKDNSTFVEYFNKHNKEVHND